MKNTSLKLKPVDPRCFSDLGFLYGVMERRLREPGTNISHQEMPSWGDHVDFVRNSPYRRHFIIYDSTLYVGVLYIGYDGSVGIYISPEHRRHGIATWALQQVINECKIANINLLNEPSMRLFEKAGFKFRRVEKTQYVYERTNERITTD